MQADHGIRDEIDRSFGEGRRLLAGTGTALAVVAICGTAAVAAGGAGTHASPVPGYAVPPSASPTAPARSVAPALWTPSRREVDKALTRPLARYSDNGRLVVDPEATVVRRVDDLFPNLPGRSVALELDYRRARYWVKSHTSRALASLQTVLATDAAQWLR